MPIDLATEDALTYEEREAQLQAQLRASRTRLFELSQERDAAIKSRARSLARIGELNELIALARQEVFIARAELRVLLNEQATGGV